jgi:hypothetical protein
MTGHINVMLVLQSCTDSLHILPGSSSETQATQSDGACNNSSITVEKDVDVIEEIFTAINKETEIGIKQEEIPEDITFPDIKSEPDEVSYLCVCLLLDTFCQCPEMSVVFVMSVFLANCKSSSFGNEYIPPPPHFGVSAWRLKCTKRMGHSSDVVQ